MKHDQELEMLTKEYHQGMVMYELMQKEVYQKAAEDSIGRLQFYESNKASYMHPESVSVSYFICKNEKIVKQVQKLLSQRPGKYFTDELIAQQINKKNEDNLIIEHAKYYKDEHTRIDSLKWIRGYTTLIEPLKIIVINEVLEPEAKNPESIKKLLTADYQTFLEERLFERLNSSYRVSINSELLDILQQYSAP
jgi:peptidyl-prolyl cis-trans isomerase SurA